ncbi:MAG: glycosyltransferase family 9 protein [Gemmatimonadota bacterium]
MSGPPPAAPGRVLLVQLHHLGDVLLCTPAVRTVRAAFPGTRLDFLTGSAGAEALADNPHVDGVVAGGKGLAAWWRIRRRLRAAAYDVVVDFHSTPRTARWVAATRAPVRIGVRGRGPRNRLYTLLCPREGGPVYMARQKMDLLAPLGVEPRAYGDLRLEMHPGPAAHARADAILRTAGLDGPEPVIALSTVARVPAKRWSVAAWAAVGNALTAAGARVLLTSGPGERHQARAVAERMTGPSVWDYGATTVRELAALYGRCAAWGGNDGGPKHMAAAVGTPTVTVFLPGMPAVWNDPAPVVPQVAFERAAGPACASGCGTCSACLGGVDPQDVAAALLTAAAARRGGEVSPCA